MNDEFQYLPSQSSEKKIVSHNLDYSLQANQRAWDDLVRQSPLNRLRFYDAQLARGIDVNRDRVAELVREAGAAAVLSDRDAIGLVRQLWGERAVERLRERARTTAEKSQ